MRQTLRKKVIKNEKSYINGYNNFYIYEFMFNRCFCKKCRFKWS